MVVGCLAFDGCASLNLIEPCAMHQTTRFWLPWLMVEALQLSEREVNQRSPHTRAECSRGPHVDVGSTSLEEGDHPQSVLFEQKPPLSGPIAALPLASRQSPASSYRSLIARVAAHIQKSP